MTTQVLAVNLRCCNVGKEEFVRINRFGQLTMKNVSTR